MALYRKTRSNTWQRHRLRIQGAALPILAVLFVPVAQIAAAQPAPSDLRQVTVVAVAPFIDEVGMRDELARWSTTRLGELVPSARFKIVPFDQTAQALRDMGLRLFDLNSLQNVAELGTRLGVDAVFSGRLVRVDVDPGGRPSPGRVPEGPREAFVVLDLRLVVVSKRQVVLHAEVSGTGFGFFALRTATERALQEFIRQLTRVL